MAWTSSEQTCFRIALALTEKSELNELRDAFIDALGQILDLQESRLFEIEYRRSGRKCRSAHDADPDRSLVRDVFHPSIEETLSSQPGFIECIESEHAVTLENPETPRYTTLFPVEGLHGINQILQIRVDQVDQEQQEKVRDIINLYSNQYKLLRKSSLDQLTQLLNRNTFNKHANSMLTRILHQDGEKHAACLALIDVDHFKRINDSFGHLYGDEVLLLLAQIMENAFRYEDLLFRYGGEEFAVILSNADLQTATQVLERFRNTVANYHFPQLSSVTVSAGVTQARGNTPIDLLIQRADQALYYAKHHGRNQVCQYEKLAEEGKLAPETVPREDVQIF
jgi:diguanylate cyclase (GGDEF)-like protein